ncbi:MAG TPA: redox-regulated ATPase YchF [Firmicutes bacterium]|nr:redox-regulated ATPase YchF [Bacillota bacterium]
MKLSFSLGIVGLPNAGKSTLFNAVVGGNALTAPYPFTTINRNLGTVAVPDKRLDSVREITGSAAVTYASVELVDIAGLVKGASKGEGLGNQFLGHIREVDGILHVVRAYGDDPDPRGDAEIVDLELALADLAVVERQLESRRSAAKSGNKEAIARLEAAETVREHLLRNGHARELSPETLALVRDLFLITAKPMLYVANVDEKYAGDPASSPGARELQAYAEGRGLTVIGVCAKFEEELMALGEEGDLFAQDAGISVPASQLIIVNGYKMLNLISFFTANKNEARSWSLRAGSTAIEAAEKVHTQMARGFIKAEVVPWDALVKAGGIPRARELGLLRVEGRDYVVKDGDVLYFRFSP